MSFRGTSAEGLEAVLGELQSALTGGADAAVIGAELFAVAGVLRSEPALRRIATDMSVATGAKQTLVTEIFGDKVSGATLDLVHTALGRRWTATRDLPDALEHVGVVAVVRSADADSGRLVDELFGFGQVVTGSPDLRDALSDRSRSIADKATLLHTLLDGKALDATRTLAEQALHGTYRTVGAALTAFQQVAADVHSQKIATVHVARPLSDAERGRLTAALASHYHRDVHLNVVVDPEVLGGIRVEIGADVIDGTVVSRLDAARRKLAG
ncbi:MAG: F0F1 ATP synthase subunit delta [Nocardioidaceae bacterium]|nr:F0F1 ATP synthase subunit delta [Nocardioidaceae bacterium]